VRVRVRAIYILCLACSVLSLSCPCLGPSLLWLTAQKLVPLTLALVLVSVFVLALAFVLSSVRVRLRLRLRVTLRVRVRVRIRVRVTSALPVLPCLALPCLCLSGIAHPLPWIFQIHNFARKFLL
jgi:hypothetical protein